MSAAVDTIYKLHQLQLAAAVRSGSRVVQATQRLTDALDTARSKVPALPGALAGPLEKVTVPTARVLGTPAEHRAAQIQRLREWTEAQHEFRSGVLRALDPADEPAPVASVTPVS